MHERPYLREGEGKVRYGTLQWTGELGGSTTEYYLPRSRTASRIVGRKGTPSYGPPNKIGNNERCTSGQTLIAYVKLPIQGVSHPSAAS